MNFIEDSMQMDEKCVYSHGVFNLLALVATVTAAVMELTSLIVYFINPNIGLYTYSVLFYPSVLALVIAFFYSKPEIIRGSYLSSILYLTAASVLLAWLIVTIILQAVFLEAVYIIPFLPH